MDKITRHTQWSNLSYNDVQRELEALRSSDIYYKNPMSRKDAMMQMDEDR